MLRKAGTIMFGIAHVHLSSAHLWLVLYCSITVCILITHKVKAYSAGVLYSNVITMLSQCLMHLFVDRNAQIFLFC